MVWWNKYKDITQPNNHEDEVEEFRFQERLIAMREMESIVFPISPTILVNTSLFFNNIEEHNIFSVCNSILKKNTFEYL